MGTERGKSQLPKQVVYQVPDTSGQRDTMALPSTAVTPGSTSSHHAARRPRVSRPGGRFFSASGFQAGAGGPPHAFGKGPADRLTKPPLLCYTIFASLA